ncbi:UvrD-helicase domain-containing protein [Planococcus maritimus]|uniref:UvrD-helicase domain-containing protein n=1 Tax=Planococcus maritimus TaxID=192421 RepID=UPI00232A9BC8|nr:UvrD-helicase domain-containing protein [Planococcus maritimus]
MNWEEQLEVITPKILPQGFSFLEQQKAAILADGSLNIVAGPGSGKTTVLIAKCAILLNQLKSSNKGICLITHTNVAVDEIKNGLKKIGIKNIEYPNFIGTIQEFFNVFFAKKGFAKVNSNSRFRVLDDDEYSLKFAELFDQYKPHFYTFNPPNPHKSKPRLLISNDADCTVSSDAKSSYKVSFEKCLHILFKRGFLTNQQCLEISDWYITKYQEPIKKALSHRFKYVLLDETQDTNILQYELLNRIFSNKNVCFQKFGDPYQALYNIFDDNIDAWMPKNENNYEEISETTRFGSSIANVVRNVCIERYDTFKSHGTINSFPPHYFFYDDEDDLIFSYQKLISTYEKESLEFRLSLKKDSIVSSLHDDLINLFSTYQKPTSKPKLHESKTIQIYRYLLKLISKESGVPIQDVLLLIEENLEYKVKLANCIKKMLGNSNELENVIETLEKILTIITEGEKESFVILNLKNALTNFQQEISTLNLAEIQKTSDEFKIGTVHSVKGETHRSTLLVLNTTFKNYSQRPPLEFPIFDLVKEYFAGNYIELDSITNIVLKNETKKALKLAYVALSRPTHLAAIAIPKEYLESHSELFSRMDSLGWKEFSTC